MHHHLFNSDPITFFPLLIPNSWNELKARDLENFWKYKPDTFNCFHHHRSHNEQNSSLLFPAFTVNMSSPHTLCSDTQIAQLRLAPDDWQNAQQWSVTV